jgi:glutathione S-transferase
MGDIAINRPLGHFEFGGDGLGGDDKVRSAHYLDDLKQSVGAAHGILPADIMLSAGMGYNWHCRAQVNPAPTTKGKVLIMITLYHAPQSRSSRMIWLLEELEVPYQIKPVSIFRPMSGTGASDPNNPHPDGQVPAIVDGDVLVAESVAIVLYLTDAYPKAGMGPVASDPRRGDYLTWLAWYSAELETAMFASMGGDLANSPMKQRGYDAAIKRLENALAPGPWLMGETFSGADILVGSAINFARSAFPKSATYDAYAARCKSRPAALRALQLDDASGIQHSA